VLPARFVCTAAASARAQAMPLRKVRRIASCVSYVPYLKFGAIPAASQHILFAVPSIRYLVDDAAARQYKRPWKTLVKNARVYTSLTTRRSQTQPITTRPYSFVWRDLRAEPR